MLSILSLLLASAATVLAHNSTLSENFKRGSSNRFSNYFAGESQGACGWWNTDAEFVVALTQLEWDNGAHCGKEVNINWQGKSTTAKIVDECMECPWDALDFSQSLFSFFVGEGNNEEVGYIYGDWSYADGGSKSGGDNGGGGNNKGDDGTTTTTTTKAKPTSTTTTTTKAKPTSTTTTTTSSSSKTTSHTSSKASTAAASKSASASASATVASSSPSATGAENFAGFSQALLFLNHLVVDARAAAV